MTLRRKVLYSLLPALLVYVVAEAIATTLYLRGDMDPVSIWIHEEIEDGSTIQFDPITGYRLTQTPSRMACIATNGVVESVGTIRGNNQGFPDRDDFEAKKSGPSLHRFAVFGDSFSAAQYLEVNWPDRSEELAGESGIALELLNFSIDGGGYLNWWRALQGVIDADGYELDGVIFAVYGNDLRRPFVIWDDRVVPTGPDGTRSIGFGTVHTFDAAELPKTDAEARPYFHGLPRWQIVSTAQLDRMLRGEIRPSDGRSFRLSLTRRLLDAISQAAGTSPGPSHPEAYSDSDVLAFDSAYPGRNGVWTDMRHFLEERRLPSLVIDVPSRERLLRDLGTNAEAEAFARILDASYVDGAEAFAGLSPDEIRDCWLPYDGHWGQLGSDRFAGWMFALLKEELAE